MKQTVHPKATARILGGRDYPMIRGTVTFVQRHDGVLVEAAISGLPKTETGFFAFHIHEGGSCTGTAEDPFADAKTHYDPGGCPHPCHSGDMPPLYADKNGTAKFAFVTDRFTPEEIIGRTIIIHANPDDFHTQPSGNSGEKIACGVIEKMG